MQGGDHTNDVVNPHGGGEKQAEIYTHDAPWLIYACNWSVRCLLLLFTFLYYVCVVFKVAIKSFYYWVVFSLSSSYNARIENRMRSEREWI